jgi:uncharacterized membrane protein
MHFANAATFGTEPSLMPPRFVIDAFTGAGDWIRLGLEALGALTIAVGAITTTVKFVRGRVAGRRDNFTAARFELSRHLVLALEFQLAADVLETGINPTWDRIAILAAIATIRTALNFFVTREMADERRQLAARQGEGAGAVAGAGAVLD